MDAKQSKCRNRKQPNNAAYGNTITNGAVPNLSKSDRNCAIQELHNFRNDGVVQFRCNVEEGREVGGQFQQLVALPTDRQTKT